MAKDVARFFLIPGEHQSALGLEVFSRQTYHRIPSSSKHRSIMRTALNHSLRCRDTVAVRQIIDRGVILLHLYLAFALCLRSK